MFGYVINVACYNADYSGHAFTVYINDYYEAKNERSEMCDLRFDITQGEILESSPDVLGKEE